MSSSELVSTDDLSSETNTIISDDIAFTMTEREKKHWVISIGDGDNFSRSSRYGIWGMNSKSKFVKYFVKNVIPGDILWFKVNKSVSGVVYKLYYMAELKFLPKKRELGPLISVSLTNTELGWNGGDWDYEIFYDKLYKIDRLNLVLKGLGMSSCLEIHEKHSDFSMEEEYQNIIRYSQVESLSIEE